jgi:hypothetical protein
MDARTFLDRRIKRLEDAARATGCELPSDLPARTALEESLVTGDASAVRLAVQAASAREVLKALEGALKDPEDGFNAALVLSAALEGMGTTARELGAGLDPNVHGHVARELGKLLRAQRPTRRDLFADLFGRVRTSHLLELLGELDTPEAEGTSFSTEDPFITADQAHALAGAIRAKSPLGERGQVFLDEETTLAVLTSGGRGGAVLAWRAGTLGAETWEALGEVLGAAEVVAMASVLARTGEPSHAALPQGLCDVLAVLEAARELEPALRERFREGNRRNLALALLEGVPLGLSTLGLVLRGYPDLAARWVNRDFPLQRREEAGSHEEVREWALNTQASCVNLREVRDVTARRILVSELDGVGQRFVKALDEDETAELEAYLPLVLEVMGQSAQALEALVMASSKSPMTNPILTLDQSLLVMENRRKKWAARKAEQD